MTTATDLLTVARAEAVFSSYLDTGSNPTYEEVTLAIQAAIRSHGGTRGCAAVLAGEYGEHPETAVHRMRWALDLVRTAYSARLTHSGSGTCPFSST